MLKIAFGLSPDDAAFADMREEFFQNYERRMTQATTIFDGVPQLLDDLVRRRLHWGVVTNKSKRFTEPLTRQMPLFATAGAIVSATAGLPRPAVRTRDASWQVIGASVRGGPAHAATGAGDMAGGGKDIIDGECIREAGPNDRLLR